jgi:hypothetical protein
MTSSCSFAFQLILLLLFSSCQCPSQAQTCEGSSETACSDIGQDDTGCSETACSGIEQDDTGLLQAPVRKAVEVTKVRSTVGNAKSSRDSDGSEKVGVVKETAAANAPADSAAAELEALETAGFALGETGDLPIGTLPLSFFQLNEQEGSGKPETPEYDQILADGSVQPSGSIQSGSQKQADLVWNATEMTESSLRAKLAQIMLLCVAVALIANFFFRWYASVHKPRDALSGRMRKKLECMHVATGPEIRTACAIDSITDSQDSCSPMRIQGRVVAKSAGSLTAPLSGRSCVLYSASVSQHRHDGVHQPPVAFSSISQDFAVELEDCPEMLLEVNSQDVFPFDMDAGRYACELALGDAPDSWRGFMLANLTPGVDGAKGQPMNHIDLGAKGPLNFRECAMVVGSRVTCVGEVVREHNGKLRLCPWSPPPCPATEETTKSRSRSMGWLSPEADPWVNKLMISDDSRLLIQTPLQLPNKCRSCTGSYS